MNLLYFWEKPAIIELAKEVNKVKFKLIIDKTAEEEVLARVHQKNYLTDKIEEEVRNYAGENELVAYTQDDIKVLRYSEIECVTVINSKTYAFDTNGKRYKLRQRLYEVGESLPGYFIKINKSSYANRKRIERFSAAFSGSVDVIFKNGYKDYVSRRCFAEIKKELKK